jgi:hypothetical protein
MTYKLEIRPLAVIEILEAYDWYELQREGLGMEFLQELEKIYTTLQRNPIFLLRKARTARKSKTFSLYCSL